MWPESSEHKRPLRTGLTTGTCATAACVAAAHRLLGHKVCAQVTVALPDKKQQSGKLVELTMQDIQVLDQGGKASATAATIKDAGDDPDVTHGARVWVKLSLHPVSGVIFKAGTGVGQVTRAGLSLAVGEPAINPVPRQMMQTNLHQVAQMYDYQGGFTVEIGIDEGERLAQKTMNARLGIAGGLSVLGTTGVVRPFSCAAWVASIYQGIDVAYANGYDCIGAATGNASEAYIQKQYQLDDMQLIEMGDFAGALLKKLRKGVFAQLLLCGGIAKLSKLAQGHLDLHSSRSSIDFEHLARLAQQQGANQQLASMIKKANTCAQTVALCQAQGIDLVGAICQSAWDFASGYIPDKVQLKVIAVNRDSQWLGEANHAAVALGTNSSFKPS